jgi:hypothetical protein
MSETALIFKVIEKETKRRSAWNKIFKLKIPKQINVEEFC